ncbi:MAG TPA: hypothetical protein VND15_00805 [Candidatus Acidoferrales bacterium]|nr:hypothetical protein [Candidatus Acidoferrales bacterium]
MAQKLDDSFSKQEVRQQAYAAIQTYVSGAKEALKIGDRQDAANFMTAASNFAFRAGLGKELSKVYSTLGCYIRLEHAGILESAGSRSEAAPVAAQCARAAKDSRIWDVERVAALSSYRNYVGAAEDMRKLIKGESNPAANVYNLANLLKSAATIAKEHGLRERMVDEPMAIAFKLLVNSTYELDAIRMVMELRPAESALIREAEKIMLERSRKFLRQDERRLVTALQFERDGFPDWAATNMAVFSKEVAAPTLKAGYAKRAAEIFAADADAYRARGLIHSDVYASLYTMASEMLSEMTDKGSQQRARELKQLSTISIAEHDAISQQKQVPKYATTRRQFLLRIEQLAPKTSETGEVAVIAGPNGIFRS